MAKIEILYNGVGVRGDRTHVRGKHRVVAGISKPVLPNRQRTYLLSLWNCSELPPVLSGWCDMANVLYAVRMDRTPQPLSTPNTLKGSSAPSLIFDRKRSFPFVYLSAKRESRQSSDSFTVICGGDRELLSCYLITVKRVRVGAYVSPPLGARTSFFASLAEDPTQKDKKKRKKNAFPSHSGGVEKKTATLRLPPHSLICIIHVSPAPKIKKGQLY